MKKVLLAAAIVLGGLFVVDLTAPQAEARCRGGRGGGRVVERLRERQGGLFSHRVKIIRKLRGGGCG